MTDYEAYLILQHRISRHDHADDINKALEVAKTALEKQTPKKPVLSPDCDKCGKDGTDECNRECVSYSSFYPILTCPNCMKPRYLEEQHCDFCPECGQAIDWSENSKD